MLNTFFFFSVKAMINEEIANGIPAERILIGGFSQGGAVALYTAFATDVKVAGVVALSTWLPLNKKFAESVSLEYLNRPTIYPAFSSYVSVTA